MEEDTELILVGSPYAARIQLTQNSTNSFLCANFFAETGWQNVYRWVEKEHQSMLAILA